MKLLYFAWLRTHIGVNEELVTPPDDVRTVADLVGWLKTRGSGYAEALKHDSVVRVAVNQTFADPATPVGQDDEVALFPPMTGG
ncbi:molybdopterin converting factor subunit 1 [Fodinicurvata sp. EGI_FJ10296]|uniref:molybdopterin converting factor subunit 1 n=1 Tax=Fodinicurvata sp. EGI_FJ10296 TaxID=3231908 RepID=UPI0034572BDE